MLISCLSMFLMNLQKRFPPVYKYGGINTKNMDKIILTFCYNLLQDLSTELFNGKSNCT